MRYFSFAILPCALVFACSSSSDVSVPVQVSFLAGQEPDPFTASPSPTHVKLDLVQAADGTRSVLAEGAPSPSGIALPVQHFTAPQIARFEMTATDATGVTLVWGSSVPYLIYDIDGYALPIFVARTGGWSRPPDTLEHPHRHPVAAVELHDNLILAGGDAVPAVDPAVPDIYSVARWVTLRGQPSLPLTPKSMAVVGVALLCIDDNSGAWLELSHGLTATAPAPSGLSFSEVAGGETIALPDGTRYIVGSTRPAGDPTAKVLRIDGNGTLRAVTMATARLGAAAAVLSITDATASSGNRTTLVVAGGSATGDWAEALNPSEDGFTPLPITAASTAGLGLASLDAKTAVVAGGKDVTTRDSAPVRVFDPTCTAGCTTADVVTLPTPLVRTKVFVVGSGKILVVGESDDGQNHAYAVDTTAVPVSAIEQTLREPRKDATALVLPNTLPGLVGGVKLDSGAPALTIEAFVP
jgi:hypothetical protein